LEIERRRHTSCLAAAPVRLCQHDLSSTVFSGKTSLAPAMNARAGQEGDVMDSRSSLGPTRRPVLRKPAILAMLAGAALAAGVSAAAAQTASLEAIAGDMGADRTRHLLEGAKREGEFALYSTMPVNDNNAIVAAFEAKYGIKVKVWRGGSEEIRQRVLTEAAGRRFQVDVVLNTGLDLEPLRRENLLQKIPSPHRADLLPAAAPAHQEWVGIYLNAMVQAYNTNLVKKAELPKSYADLLDPKWKGRLGIEAADYDWFATVVTQLGEEKGLKFFRDLVATNGLSVRKGHTLLVNLSAAGEVPLALTVFSYSAQQAKAKGAPVDWFAIAPAIAMPNGVGVTRRAPHPHAAVLFHDFMISDGQELLRSRNFIPASTKVKAAFDYPLLVEDAAAVLDHAQKWEDLYQNIVIRQGR
jgi:iron(III) transport system substrate-binding protein